MRGDDGVTLILFALVLLTLMALAALVIDVGAGYNLRRQDQSAADSAALAAVASLNVSPAEMALQAKTYAHSTLGVSLSDARWNSCAAVSGWTAVSGTSCVDYRGDSVRVRLPIQQYATTFGRAVGVANIQHTAFAIASLRPAGFGGVLPFAVTGTSSSGGFGCLKSNSNGAASSWCGSTSGNFGFLDFSQFGGNTLQNTTTSCGSGGFNARVRDNIAMGSDHDLSIYGGAPHNSTQVVDTTACGATPQTQRPNAANSQTGNNESDVTEGMFYRSTDYSDGSPSRLRRSAPQLFNGAGQTITVHSRTNLDNNPLWQFIPPNYGPGQATPADIPNSCKRNQFVDSSGNYTLANLPAAVQTFLTPFNQRDRVLGLLQRCFAHYMGQTWNGFPVGSLTPAEAGSGCTGPCDAAVFTRDETPNEQPNNLADIQYTPRFAYVPVISAFPSGQSSPVNLIRFRPIWIQRLRIETSGQDTIWDPGVTPAAPNSGSYQRVGEVSVFVFPDGMLPNGLGDPNAPFEQNKNKFVSLTR